MNDDPRARRDEKPPSPHTEDHATADRQRGDEAPEVEEHLRPRRRTLEDAAEEVHPDDTEGGRSGR